MHSETYERHITDQDTVETWVHGDEVWLCLKTCGGYRFPMRLTPADAEQIARSLSYFASEAQQATWASNERF